MDLDERVKVDILDAEYEDSKKDAVDKHDDRLKRRLERQLNNLKRLMSEQWGREVVWEFLVDCDSLKLNPYTRNADTYYILGLQRQASLCIKALKALDFGLYQLAEKEAHNRKIREEENDG